MPKKGLKDVEADVLNVIIVSNNTILDTLAESRIPVFYLRIHNRRHTSDPHVFFEIVQDDPMRGSSTF